MSDAKKSKVLTRGEKARLAAKCRRDKEAQEMSELVEEIPLDTERLERVNKSSILQVATSYIEIKKTLRKGARIIGGSILLHQETF